MGQANGFRVLFILPRETNLPIGGYKVVYEYANALVALGHKVSVALPKLIRVRTGVIGEIKNQVWPYMHRRAHPEVITWFKLDPRVQILLCSDLREKWLPDSDFVIATAWQTASFVSGYSPRLGKKMYLIQQLETFYDSYEDVIATWTMPLHKVVIAKWLGELAKSVGETSTYIPNGINFQEFGIDNPIESRKARVASLFHLDHVKGCWDGLNALELAKEQIPDLSAVFFGVPPRGRWIPKWADYVQAATSSQLRNIYNEASVFLHPSWSEGWPLPPAEAMACGAAVVAAANPGVMDYLKTGRTAIVSRPKYWTELAENLVTLLRDDKKRVELATAGHTDIQQYTWDRAANSLVQLLYDLNR